MPRVIRNRTENDCLYHNTVLQIHSVTAFEVLSTLLVASLEKFIVDLYFLLLWLEDEEE